METNFGYNALGDNTTVSVGNQNLIKNIYEEKTSNLLESDHDNGHKSGNTMTGLEGYTINR